MATALAGGLTTYTYARRGRGASGDTRPYAVARELEDVAALVEEAAGQAHLFGVSSGGMYALEAARAGLPVRRVAVYEVPYDVDPDVGDRYLEYRRDLEAALSEGRRGDAVAMFMALAGSPAPVLVVTGGGVPFYEAAADQVADAIPNAERVQLAGQGHVVDPQVLGPVLGRFLRGEGSEG